VTKRRTKINFKMPDWWISWQRGKRKLPKDQARKDVDAQEWLDQNGWSRATAHYTYDGVDNQVEVWRNPDVPHVSLYGGDGLWSLWKKDCPIRLLTIEAFDTPEELLREIMKRAGAKIREAAKELSICMEILGMGPSPEYNLGDVGSHG
jgi:hypothetical protein